LWSGGGGTTPSRHRLVGWVTVSDGGGRARVGGMRAEAGGKLYHAPMLLGVGEIKLVFRALR
jgi:hypothetical protein